MTNLPLTVQMQLHFLRDFLKHIDLDAAKEWTELERRAEQGEFEDFGDYESAMDYPLFRAEFGTRAVYYELNALVESQLQELAQPVWQQVNPHPSTDPRKWKTVEDLPFGQVRDLLQTEYKFRLADVDGWDHVERLREVVNAYKHRNGRKRLKDITKNPVTGGYDFKYETNIDEAEELLEKIPAYLVNILTVVNGRSSDA